MLNTFYLEDRHTRVSSIKKCPQKEELCQLKLTIESSQAKEELSNMSSDFNMNEPVFKKTNHKLSEALQLGAWTESELPFIYHTPRNGMSLVKKRKLSCQDKLSSLSKRPKTSCLTEFDSNTPKSMLTHAKRQLTMSKICPSQHDLSQEGLLLHPKLHKFSNKKNTKHPFKSNMILLKMQKRNYPYFKSKRSKEQSEVQYQTQPQIQTQLRTYEGIEERPQVESMFREDKINRSTLLGFIQNINKLRLREKSKASLERG